MADGGLSPSGSNLKTTLSLVEKLTGNMDKLVARANSFRDAFEDANTSLGRTTTSGGGKLGLGSLPVSKTNMAVQGVMAMGNFLYNAAPDTNRAVAQRFATSSVSYFSGPGVSPASVLQRSNAANQGGFTSAMSMAGAAATFMEGGYSFNSGTVQNNLNQIGGMSVISGLSNEQVAAGISSMNAMNFFRVGIRARRPDGSLRSISQITNDLYRRMYGGRTPTPEQAAAVFRTNSAAYKTIEMVAGGDPNLIRQLQTAIVMQAKNKGKKVNLKDPGKMMDLMGMAPDDPARAAFNFNSSEAKVLQSTESGLVSGYSAGLNTVAGANNALAGLADAAGGVTDALMGLKGLIQTIPGAGNMGGSIAGATSAIASGGMNFMGNMLALRAVQQMAAARGMPVPFSGLMPFGGAPGAPGVTGAPGMMPVGATGRPGTGFFNRGNPLLRGGGMMIGSLAAGAATDYLKSNYFDANSNLDRAALMAARAGQYALMGAGIGALFGGVGAPIGAVLGTAYGAFQGFQEGGGMGGPSNVNTGLASTKGMGGPPGTIASPVPKGSPISSKYGPRTFVNAKGQKETGHHGGIDYGVPIGTPVYAVADGIANSTGTGEGFGTYVQIQHKGGYYSYYAHLDKKLVREGQKIRAGQLIGKSGNTDDTGRSTGPHLHFEIRKGTGKDDDINPNRWLRLAGGGGGGGGGGGTGTGDGNDGGGGGFTPLGSVGSIVGGVVDWIGDLFRGSSQTADGTSKTTIGSSGDLTVGISGLSSTGITGVNELLGTGTTTNYWEAYGALGAVDYHGGSTKELGSSSSIIKPNKPTIKRNGTKYDIGNYDPQRGLSLLQMVAVLKSAGFKNKHLQTALAVAKGESGYRPGAIGDVAIQNEKWGPSYGLFQIRSLKDWRAYGDKYRDGSRLHDPYYNAEAAFAKSVGGKYWKGAWSTVKDGTYKQHILPQERIDKLVKQLKDLNPQTPMSTLGRGGSYSDGGHGPITVNMDVKIEHATDKEAAMLAEKIKRIIENDSRYGRIGSN